MLRRKTWTLHSLACIHHPTHHRLFEPDQYENIICRMNESPQIFTQVISFCDCLRMIKPCVEAMRVNHPPLHVERLLTIPIPLPSSFTWDRSLSLKVFNICSKGRAWNLDTLLWLHSGWNPKLEALPAQMQLRSFRNIQRSQLPGTLGHVDQSSFKKIPSLCKHALILVH